VARTRQKAKQRKAKRLEQERRAAERSEPQRGPSSATAEALAEVSEAQREAAAEVQEAQRAAEVADAPQPPVPVREPAEEKVRRRERRKAEVAEKEKPRRPAREERKREREVRERGRVANFLVQVWAELRRVQWPDRNQVTQATSVVIVFCLLAGAYLGIWDFVFNRLVKAIL
jgi:preprotein translocase SecE subunit